jgi:drug/metabolite transporter (DMT)-like permease
LLSEKINRTDIILIMLVTLTWGLSYSVIKFALKDYPPIAFRTWCLVLGILALGAYLIRQRISFRVPKAERLRVFQLSALNMILWQIGLMYGVLLLNSGRAAIIGYTMPVWALLTSVLVYGARLTWQGVLGVTLALAATLLLGVAEFSAFSAAPIGVILMLGAAISWGAGTAMTRHSTLSISNEVLTFWSLVSACIALFILTSFTEYDRWRWPVLSEWLAIIYAGVVTFSFGYVAWFRVARKLPPVVSSLSIMLVPVVGLFAGSLFMGEALSGFDYAALILILLAMATVIRPAPRN